MAKKVLKKLSDQSTGRRPRKYRKRQKPVIQRQLKFKKGRKKRKETRRIRKKRVGRVKAEYFLSY